MPSKRGPESADKNPYASGGYAPLPTLTPLQFVVLDVASKTPAGVSARQLQEALALSGQDQRGPKFYQLMKRLVDAGVIESWNQEFDVAGGDVSRTYYKITAEGKVAWRLTIEFYATRMRASDSVSRKKPS